MSQTKVSYKRHLAKTISYRVVSTTIGFLGMWLATGSIKVGAAFGVIELLYKPAQYYLHERIWYRYIRYGLIEEKKKEKKETTPKIVSQPKNKTTKKVLNYSSNR